MDQLFKLVTRLVIWQRCFCWMTFGLMLNGGWSIAERGAAVLPGNHPLSPAQAGAVLLVEFRCAACHAGVESASLPEKTAPDLTAVGSRISADYLVRFLESPLEVHPGTTMPDLLRSRPAGERHEIAEALTHFLIDQSQGGESEVAPGSADAKEGERLFHTVGCVACHGPSDGLPTTSASDAPEQEEDAAVPATETSTLPMTIPLGHVRAKYLPRGLAEFLFQPLRVRSSGRMPDMKLTPAESLAITNYMIGESASASRLVPQPALVARGKQHFQELNCVACHPLPGFQTQPMIGSLQQANMTQGCLSEKPGRSPTFQLDAAQTEALVAAIGHQRTGLTNDEADRLAVASSLTAFRCIACHVREDYGGVHKLHSAYFVGSEMNLGDEGRIPPPLTLVGAKLKPAWLKRVLFDGESVRFYMATRMPQYGTANLQHLPLLFSRLDKLPGPEMNLPNPESRAASDREREKLLRSAGRELLGDKAVNCVACHKFNGKPAQVNQGIDLLTSYERLQPNWFHAYLRAPGAFRPRTIMPAAWPDGQAAFTSILDGDTNQQIEAIWYYLSLGTSAADPSGLRAVSTKLVVGDQAITRRGRSRVAGFRGIAVGLPEKICYAFNAETGTLSAIWQGEFISVNWSGQGSGDFQPASQPITLAQDVSFLTLSDDQQPWPLLPVMTKEARTNPDPLYPKNLGYQFRGYSLDESAIPTFMYRSGGINIQDRSIAGGSAERQQLLRTLRFETPQAQRVWFRALVGDVVQESEQTFQSGQLRISIASKADASLNVKIRPLPNEPTRSELLLRMELPQGDSQLELCYEPLK